MPTSTVLACFNCGSKSANIRSRAGEKYVRAWAATASVPGKLRRGGGNFRSGRADTFVGGGPASDRPVACISSKRARYFSAKAGE